MDAAEMMQTRPSDMVMSLYLRPIHPEFFKIFAWRAYEGTGYEAELWITGLSHVLTVRRTAGRAAERCVTEVIGPSGMPLPERGRVETLPLVGDSEAQFALRNGFTYRISYQAEQLEDADVFAAIYDDLRNQAHKEGLSCEYRVEGVERDVWPLAMTVPSHARGGFLLHAFHVFPDQKTILKTQTLIEIPQR